MNIKLLPIEMRAHGRAHWAHAVERLISERDNALQTSTESSAALPRIRAGAAAEALEQAMSKVRHCHDAHELQELARGYREMAKS